MKPTQPEFTNLIQPTVETIETNGPALAAVIAQLAADGKVIVAADVRQACYTLHVQRKPEISSTKTPAPDTWERVVTRPNEC